MPTPYPDPDLRYLNQLSTKERARLISDIEKNGEHRRKIEEEEIRERRRSDQEKYAHQCAMEIAHQKRATLGVFAGLAVAAMGFGAACYGFYCDHAVEAAGLAGVSLLGMIRVFLVGTATRTLELEVRREEAEAILKQTDAQRELEPSMQISALEE